MAFSNAFSGGPFSFLHKVFDVRNKEEWIKTGIMSFYFFSIIAANWMIKAVRNSLILEEFGAGFFRYLYIFEGLFLILVASAFAAFSKRVSRKGLFLGVFASVILSLVGFWFLFKHVNIPFLSAILYLFSSSFGIMMTTQFFLLANDIFDVSQGKRLFGIILSAGSIGHMLGGYLVSLLVNVVGTENLLMVIAGSILACMLLLMSVWKKVMNGHLEKKSIQEEEVKKTEQIEAKPKISNRKLLMGSSYLLLIASLIILAKMTSTVVENQFQGIVEISIEGKDARTAFYGQFYTLLGFVSFVMQLIMTSVIFRYLGVGAALFILPLGLGAFSFAAFLHPKLLLGVIMRLFDGGTNYSIQQATREVLYLPVARETRYRLKPYIDMLGFKLAKTFGGFYILLAAPLLNLPNHKLSLLVLFLIPLWLFVVVKMRKGYSKAVLDGNAPHSEEEVAL